MQRHALRPLAIIFKEVRCKNVIVSQKFRESKKLLRNPRNWVELCERVVWWVDSRFRNYNFAVIFCEMESDGIISTILFENGKVLMWIGYFVQKVDVIFIMISPKLYEDFGVAVFTKTVNRIFILKMEYERAISSIPNNQC